MNCGIVQTTSTSDTDTRWVTVKPRIEWINESMEARQDNILKTWYRYIEIFDISAGDTIRYDISISNWYFRCIEAALVLTGSYKSCCQLGISKLIHCCVKLLFVTSPPLIGGDIKRYFYLTSDVCLSVAYIGRNSRTEDWNCHRGSPRHTWLGHHFQGQKINGQGHQAVLVGCSSHCIIYMDDTIIYATAQSQPLPVDHEYSWRWVSQA